MANVLFMRIVQYGAKIIKYSFQASKIKKPGLSGLVGWKMGLEPTPSGTTIQRSNQLSYVHRLSGAKIKFSF